jgi:hypothetical protein
VAGGAEADAAPGTPDAAPAGTPDAAPGAVAEDDGCGCRVGGRTTGGAAGAAGLLLLLAFGLSGRFGRLRRSTPSSRS